ncbi:AraC family transcriptional regulator [bacterium]|nr:MAG: AraC family transcriptional regulator [bacterium]
MKSLLFDDVDYVHRDHSKDAKTCTHCVWRDFGLNQVCQEFPLAIRRERYHHVISVPTIQHDFLGFFIVRAGRGLRLTNSHPHSLARGDVFLMAPEVAHSWNASIDLTVDAIYFQENLWTTREWEILNQLPFLAGLMNPSEKDLIAREHTDHVGHLSPELHSRVEQTLSEMRRELKTGNLPQHLSARARFFSLLVQMAEWRAEKIFATRPARGAAISEVLTFCENNFASDISNRQLAELMHFSEAHFRNVFIREVGITPGAYLRQLRLQHAQELLKDPRIPVGDIARLCGYSDSTQLGRVIKKAFGISPLQLRRIKANS